MLDVRRCALFLYHTVPTVNDPRKKPLENTVGKGENAGNQHFLLFQQCFLPSTTKYSIFNPFPNKPWFLRVCSTSLLKTLWKTETLLVMSNFSFSHSVFYWFEKLSDIFIKFEIVVCNLFHFGRVQNLSFGKGLSHIYFVICQCFEFGTA